MRSPEFYKEEMRCDHLITEKVKKLWDVQMGCLEELKRVCDKHNIKYFATGGTLLGAIRHKGYIPWDDDLDVAMMMDDYIKFIDVAKDEIKAPYYFQSFETELGFGPSLSRIRNCSTTACTEFEYTHCPQGYNMGIFIDIFPLTGVAPSSLSQYFQKSKVFFWRTLLAGYESESMKKLKLAKMSTKDYAYLLAWICAKPFTNHKQLSWNFLHACDYKNAKSVGLISFMSFNKRYIWDSEDFDEIIQVPFEDTTVAVPANYDKLLRHTYGDYNVFVKGAAIHSMKLFDPDRPYTTALIDRLQ